MWKLVGLGLVEAALVALLLVPIRTHVVVYDTAQPVGDRGIEVLERTAITLVGFAITIAAICIPIWLTYRLIQQVRKSN
jgi:hypothetical protein